MHRKTKYFDYLKKLYILKCKAIYFELQKIRDKYLKLNLSFEEADKLAYQDTDYLRDRIHAMPSTKMFWEQNNLKRIKRRY